MFTPRFKLTAAMTICVVIFAAGVTRLFWMRFQRGDLYPPYSSLRSDPLGTQVLYESLADLNPGGIQRNYTPLDQLHPAPETALIVLGVSPESHLLDADMWQSVMDHIFKTGGRLVLTFKPGRPTRKSLSDPSSESDRSRPERQNSSPNGRPDSEKEEEVSSSEKKDNDSQVGDQKLDGYGLPWNSLMTNLKISIHQAELGSLETHARCNKTEFPFLPEEIVWRSPYYFKLQDAAWQVVYGLREQPAMVTRPWGKGAVFISTDSYLLSNEALRTHRVAELLAWLIPRNRPVIVDELHHGLASRPGIAHLMRRYGLHGVAVTILVLVALFIWRQSAVFVPASGEAEEGYTGKSMGNDAREGWIRLMQQHITRRNLLHVCHATWRQSPGIDRLPRELLDRIETLTDTEDHKDPVARYQEICQLLKQGKHS